MVQTLHSATTRLALLSSLLGVLFALSFSRNAEAKLVIQQPGAHPKYSFEVEPQFVYRWGTPYRGRWDWDGRYWGGNGIGPGVRFSIPFMHNGPISSLNNNIGISFGASTTFHGCYCDARYNATVLSLPVLFQWNFFITDVFSALGEVGLNAPITFYNRNVDRRTHFDVEPMFQLGGKAQWGVVGIVARLGWPMISIGANFQF